MRHAFVVTAVLLGACGRSPTAPLEVPEEAPGRPAEARSATVPCPVQDMGCFHFTGTLMVGTKGPYLVAGWNVDTPKPGYANVWHYALDPPAGSWLKSLEGGAHKASVHGKAVVGGYYQEAFAWRGEHLPATWRLDMYATDPKVAAQFTAVAGNEETRSQWYTVTTTENGGAKLEIFEPCPGGAEWCPPGG